MERRGRKISASRGAPMVNVTPLLMARLQNLIDSLIMRKYLVLKGFLKWLAEKE